MFKFPAFECVVYKLRKYTTQQIQVVAARLRNNDIYSSSMISFAHGTAVLLSVFKRSYSMYSSTYCNQRKLNLPFKSDKSEILRYLSIKTQHLLLYGLRPFCCWKVKIVELVCAIVNQFVIWYTQQCMVYMCTQFTLFLEVRPNKLTPAIWALSSCLQWMRMAYTHSSLIHQLTSPIFKKKRQFVECGNSQCKADPSSTHISIYTTYSSHLIDPTIELLWCCSINV